MQTLDEGSEEDGERACSRQQLSSAFSSPRGTVPVLAVDSTSTCGADKHSHNSYQLLQLVIHHHIDTLYHLNSALVAYDLNMPSETDPLLPQNGSAPEITGYGFSKPSSERYDLYNEAAQVYNRAPEEDSSNDDEVPTAQFEGGVSPIRTFAALFAVTVGFAVIVTFLVPGLLDQIWDPSNNTPNWGPKSPSTIPDTVSKILSSTPLIDGHNDLAITIRVAYQNNIYGKNFTTAFENGTMVSQVDLPRLKAGRVGGSFWSAFTPCLANGTDFDNDAIHARSVATTLSQIDLLHRLTQSYPTTFSSPLLNSTAALSAFQQTNHLISPLGIEGLHQIGHSLSTLRLYHSLGVKYATLTHNCYNHYADPALLQDPATWTVRLAPPYWNGLSPAGITLIKEMNRMGMLIDLSHVSHATMRDVLGGNPGKFAGSRSPVIFSHSSAYALCPHPRNVPDDVLRLVRETGSLVMVNFAPAFISCLPATTKADGEEEGEMMGLPEFFEGNATLHQVAKHIVYIGRETGYEFVGIGSDFDGIPAGPRGLEHVGLFPELVGELLRMGVSEGDVRRVVGANVLRVWGEAEKVAVRMQGKGVVPAEDEIYKF